MSYVGFRARRISACAHDEVKYPLPMFCPRNFFKMGLSLKPKYPGGGTRVEALWRKATNDAVSMPYDAVEKSYEVAKKSFKYFVVFLVEARANKDDILRQIILALGLSDSSTSFLRPKSFRRTQVTSSIIIRQIACHGTWSGNNGSTTYRSSCWTGCRSLWTTQMEDCLSIPLSHILLEEIIPDFKWLPGHGFEKASFGRRGLVNCRGAGVVSVVAREYTEWNWD